MIIKSLLDTDFYKFTMLQGFWKCGMADVVSEYKFVDRSNTVYTFDQVEEIQTEVALLSSLSFTSDELDYLRTLGIFQEDFIATFLTGYTLPECADFSHNADGTLDIRFKGELRYASMFEIYTMAIISEVVCRGGKGLDMQFAMSEIDQTIDKLNAINGFNLADFGTRRRYSADWHDTVVGKLYSHAFFKGTSNVYLSMKYGLKPVGTMAHEWFQVHQGFFDIEASQTQALKNWDKIYPNGKLGVALTDIFNMDIFCKDFKSDALFTEKFHGLRHDSGNPLEWAAKAIALFKETSGTLEGKSLVFSDGLTVDKAIDILDTVNVVTDRQLNVVFGIGTKLTNNVGVKAPNMVIKNVYTDGRPTVKISDEPGKTICEDEQFVKSVQERFKNWSPINL